MESHSHGRSLSGLACDLELNLGRMIQDVIPAKPSTLRQEHPLAPLGLLDTMPVELLSLVLNYLDFQSLSRFSRVSFRGKIVVESLLSYKQVMQHAPKLLTALAKTNLISLYSASLVLQTLRTSRCVSCFDFGAFLYLPTCERVCLECLYQNRGLWMITIATAKKCFCLTQRRFQTIPIMRIIPGTYSVRTPEKKHYRVNQLVVSVRHAKQLGLDVHNSLEIVAHYMPLIEDRKGRSRFYEFNRYLEAPLEPPGRDMSKIPEKANIGNDPFAGVASLRVPYITPSGADWGYLCQGCQVTYRHFKHGSLPSAVLSRICPPDVNPDRPLFASTTRLYSYDGLLDHVETCYGIQQMSRERSNSGGSED